MKTGRKISGGRYKARRKRRITDRIGQEIKVKLGDTKRKSRKIRGGAKKVVLFSEKIINVKLQNGKTQKTEITNVLETPSNKFLARQNVLTKGTIVETALGKAKITSRPTQHGIVNGIII